ncbi:DUF3499 family protein, partial [Ilumatobacter sp.]|uniref:DUF3499 family protein n=1 Tax=Ilumatobacter sp. TaxID=1967498 RepID=UPI003C4BC5AF
MDAGAGTSLFDQIARGLAPSAAADDIDHSDVDRDDPGADDGVVIGRSRTWPAPDISTQIERPSIAERQCSRTGCSDAAAVTLSYHYGQSQVWIDRLSPEREPHMYDMCDRHADR